MNHNYKERDRILFGEYNPDAYIGGVRYFHNLNRDSLKILIDNDFIALNECQNDSPSTEEFLEYANCHNNVLFNGYAVSPSRSDYRVTIEEVRQTMKDPDEIVAFANNFSHADEFNIETVDEEYRASAWWD